jgi:hypothetical protein
MPFDLWARAYDPPVIGNRLRLTRDDPARLALPKAHQYEDQGNDGQPQMSHPQARFGEQIVGPGFARQPNSKNSGKQQHGATLKRGMLTIDVPSGENVFDFTTSRSGFGDSRHKKRLRTVSSPKPYL